MGVHHTINLTGHFHPNQEQCIVVLANNRTTLNVCIEIHKNTQIVLFSRIKNIMQIVSQCITMTRGSSYYQSHAGHLEQCIVMLATNQFFVVIDDCKS